MSEPHPIRQTIKGWSDNNDRLWILHTPEGPRAITEYNHELTGFDIRLNELDSLIFHYGGNAYYILGRYAFERGWRVENIEDRR